MSKPIAILIAGEPIASVKASRGGYAELIRRAARLQDGPGCADFDVRGGVEPPPPREFSAIVVTGSSSSVTDREPWVLAAESYLRRAVEERVHVFGICFGHQMLGQALGGLVERNPRGREIGTVDFEIVCDDPIFAELGGPGAPPCRANATHVDSVTRLPPGATVLARTALDPNAAIRFGETAWGVQFHPEMDGAIVRAYLEARRALVASEGLDPDQLLLQVDDGVAGTETLRGFFSLVRRKGAF